MTTTSISYIPYLESDVTAVVDIVKASSESSAVVAALVLNDQVNTHQSFERSQDLLKRLLQRELVERASGAIRPKLSRYADLIFFMEDGRLYLDEDELPVFRPGNEDGSIVSLQAKVSQVLIQYAKEKAKSEVEDSPLSVQLLNKVLGHGTEREVQALRHLALLLSKVNADHDSQKESILQKFLRATKGTTNDQLLKRKSELQNECSILEKKLSVEVTVMQRKENELKALESNFRDILTSMNLEGDLFDVETFLQNSTDFSVILQAYIDRFELLKSKEKAEHDSINNLSNYKEQRLKLQSLVKSNEADRARIQEEIEKLKKDIVEYENQKTVASAEKIAAQNKKEVEERKEQEFRDRKEKLEKLKRNELKTVADNVPVKSSELSRIEQEGVKTELLREASQNLKAAYDTENRCKRDTSDRNKTLNSERSWESTKHSEWKNCCTQETNARNTYFQTESKIKDGKSTKNNPAKRTAEASRDRSIEATRTAKARYDTAVRDRQDAEKQLDRAQSAEIKATQSRKKASGEKESAVRQVQSTLDQLVHQANASMHKAMRQIEDAKTKISSQSDTIKSRAEDIAVKRKDLKEEEDNLVAKEKLIDVSKKKLKDLEDKEDEEAANADNPPVDDFHIWLDGESWDGNTWKDKSTNRNHPKIHGMVNKGTVIGENNSKTTYLWGDTNSGVTFQSGWPSGKDYTFFHLANYDTSVGDGWGIFTDRGSSSSAVNSTVRVDGKDLSKTPFHQSPSTDVAIDHATWGEERWDWAAAMVLVYDRCLSDNEIESVEDWIRTKYYLSLKPPSGASPPDADKSYNEELEVILDQRKRIAKDLEAHSKKKISFEKKIAEIVHDIQDLEKKITASPSERLKKREVAKEARDKALRDLAGKSAAQVEALVISAGYRMFGAWGGRVSDDKEDSVTALLRTLVADIKGLSRPTKIRTSQPSESFEQLIGADVDSCDIETVENIVQKLRGTVQYGNLDEIEYCVKQEFEEDLNVLPPESVLVDDFTNSTAVEKNKDFILNPLKTTSQRLLYKQKALYEDNSTVESFEWVLLNSACSQHRNPLEDMMEKLASLGESEWASESCAKHLLTSWLTSKSMTLSSIEELSRLINKLEDMSRNPRLAVTEFRIFHEIVEKEDNLIGGLSIDTSLRVAAGIVSRLLSLQDAVVDAERNIISSTNTKNIVAMASRVRKSFMTFYNEISEKAVYLVKLEIQRRKTSILTGDYDNLGGSSVEHASSLDELIKKQNDEVNKALQKKEELKEKLEKIHANTKRNSDKWLEYKGKLEDQISQLKKNIRDKDEVLQQSLAGRNKTEEEILKQLEDSDKLREQLQILQNQKEVAQEKVDRAKTAAEKARQDVIEADGEVSRFKKEKDIVQENLDNVIKRKKEHEQWASFMSGLAKELTDTEVGITKHPELARGYQSLLEKSGHTTSMFAFISTNFPALKQQADMFSETANPSQMLDLRKALNQHLVEFPIVDTDVSGSGIITVRGISLSYREIESALETFVTNRCSNFGLYFDDDGYLAVGEDRIIPSIKDLPDQIQKVISDRIQLYIEPDVVNDSGEPSWKEFMQKTTYKAFAAMFDDFDRGIKKWDVLREYAKTIEVIVAKTVVIDKNVELPGFNFFVTAGGNITIKKNVSINSSPSGTIDFKHKKAKNGDKYKSDDGKPKGHNGDHGQYGKAGMNAGHVTLNASQTLSWNGQLDIHANGGKGANGQTGGDGERGKVGRDGPSVPDDANGMINGWGGQQVAFAWSRPPGRSNDGTPKLEEISGRGGDGGAGGLGGQGGGGGEIVLKDSESYFSQKHSSPKFGVLALNISSKDGNNGKDGGHGIGGEGGDPGKQKPDKAFNKPSFFHATKEHVGILKEPPEHKEGLSKNFFASMGVGQIASGALIMTGFVVVGGFGLLVTSLTARKEDGRDCHNWGFSEHLKKSFSKKDFKNKKPFIGSCIERDGGVLATGAKGRNGEERMNSTERKERKMREYNLNISVGQEYQSQQYTRVQSLKLNDAFAQATESYAKESEKMQREINGLQQKMKMTEHQIQSSEMNLNKVQKQSERLAKEQEKLTQELEAMKSSSNKLQHEVTQNDKETLSKILASLEQTEEIKALTLELSNLLVDSKYQGQLANKLQAVMSTLETRAILQQAKLHQRQEMLDKEIDALTAEMMRTEQTKGELANVNTVSQLNALLSRAQTLNNELTISQQEVKQKSVQVEVDDEDDVDDKLTGASILLSVRDTFVHGSSSGSVWPDLASKPKAREAINAILSSVPSIPEEKRALTLELLEVLTRYSIFNKRFEILEDILPLEDQRKAHEVVQETLQQVKEELATDHWFIGSIAGVSILMSSSNNITVDEASLTCRYEGIESLPIGQTLTKNERSAVRFVRDLETQGHSFQKLAQFLKQYTDAVGNAISLKGNGFLTLLQGKPVKFIDKFSRMILSALERDDDELAMHNVEIAIGMANNIRKTIEGLDLLVLYNSLLRKRDMRGNGGGFTRLFLDNAKAAQDRLDAGQREEALVQLRSKGQKEDQITIYGPRNLNALLDEIAKVKNETNSEVVSNTLIGVGRALSSGITVGSKEDLDKILSRLKDIKFPTVSSNKDMIEAAEGPLKVISTVCLDLIGRMYSGGDDEIASFIRNAGVSRLNVVSLPAAQFIKRVLAFFHQVDSISKDDTSFRKFVGYLSNHAPLPYPVFDTKSKEFLDTLVVRPQEYEDAVEDVASKLMYEWIDSENSLQNPSELVQKIVTACNAGPILNSLQPLAFQIISLKAYEEVRKHGAKEVSPNTLKEIRGISKHAFEQVANREKSNEEVERIVSTYIFSSENADKLRSMWKFLCGESSPSQEDIGLLVLAIIQGSDDSGACRAHSQLHAASFLWSNWPDTIARNLESLTVLHDTSIAAARVVFKKVLSSLSQHRTTATPYLRELVEGTLDVIGKYLKSRPSDKMSRDLYAKITEIVLALNTMTTIILDKKKEAERTKVLAEKESEHLLLDINLTKWMLKLFSEMFQSDFDGLKVSEVMKAFSSFDHNTVAENLVDVESTLRGVLRGVFEDQISMNKEAVHGKYYDSLFCFRIANSFSIIAQLLNVPQIELYNGLDGESIGNTEKMSSTFKLQFARCVCVTTISWSEQKHVALFDSNEAIDVAKLLFQIWNNDPSRNDFCTAGIAIFQSLVLETREREYESSYNAYTCNDISQAELVNAATFSLPKTTASTTDTESPALLSENSRRVQFWKVCLSQINDELLHDCTINIGSWATINSELSMLKENCDAFENALIQKVNQTIYKRRKEQINPQGTPKILKEFRDEWSKENWEYIQILLRLIQYEDDPSVPPLTFDFNTQLVIFVDAMAGNMDMLKNIKTSIHDDAMGWVLDKLSDAYCGMYIVPDDVLEGKLSRMISEISSFSITPTASAKLSSAAKHLVATLELMNPRLSRYSKVKRIMEKNFERSELKHTLSSFDDKCERAIELVSKIFATSAAGTTQISMLYTFVETLRAEQKFGTTVGEYEKKLDDLLCQAQITEKILTKEEAIKWFLSRGEGSFDKNQITFRGIAKVSVYMSDKNAYEQELVQGAYRALFEQLGARLHYVLGMALESEFNLARNAIDQQAATKQEYYKAAQMGSSRAYNNMLCNSFFEARQQRISFEDARAKALPAFQKLAESDRKAQANLELLHNDKMPTDRYSVKSPITEITSSNSDFINLKLEVHALVPLLENILYACSRGTDTDTLPFLVGDGVDQLYESLGTDEPVLVELTECIKKFISDTYRKIEKSPHLAPALNTILSNFYVGKNLDSVRDWCGLVLLLPDVGNASRVLFPEKGKTILYEAMAMENEDGVSFVIRLLPKIVSERIALLERNMAQEEDISCQTAMLQRLGKVAIANLTAYQDGSACEVVGCLQKAQTLIDYVMFEDWSDLQKTLCAFSFEMLFSLQEQTLAKILSKAPKSSYSISLVTHDDVSRGMISPVLWQDRLTDLVLSHLLAKFGKEDIKKHLVALEESFLSPSIPPKKQKPLARAEKELKEVKDAMGQIFLSGNVGNLTYCNQQYQHIFNALHYILYLTTAKYIADTRCPYPDGETQKKMREWESKREKVELESREMVKKIKGATEIVIDNFGILKKVYERLSSMDAIFHHDTSKVYAIVDKLLDFPSSSNLTMECILWLLQTGTSCVAISLLQNELENRDVATLEAVMFRVAFNLIELNVLSLTTAMDRNIRNSATSRVAALRQQQLPPEGGIHLLKILVKTTNQMIYHENKAESSKVSATKEEIEALVESLKLLVEINGWHRRTLLFKLEASSVPSRWLPELRQQSVAISLSYNPDTTSKADEEHFMKAASAIDRIRQRRGPIVAELFLQCLQLLVTSNADALTLSTISSKVSSNRWDFSAADKGCYEIAAQKGSRSEMLKYLELEAEKKRKDEKERSIKDLTDIMNEEVTGVNKSIGHFLREKDNKSFTELEWRVQCIDEKTKAVCEKGKSIAEWEKTDIIEWSKDFKKHSNLYFTKDHFEDHLDKLNEMIAVFKRVAYLIKGKDLRNPQLLAVIIFVDSMVRDEGLLGEIGTGEGKTVITILSAAARVFKGETVDVLSSSRVLAERDSIEAMEWFDYFDMSVSCNCDDEAEADPSVRKKRYHESSIVYGEAGAFQRDLLLTEFYEKDIRKKVADSLVVDEVDSLLIDEMANTLYISHEIQDLSLLNEIFVNIWLLVNGADVSNYSEGSVALVKQSVNKQIFEGKLTVPSWLKSFVDGRLETWIRNAYKAKSMTEGDQYILLQSGLKRGQVTVVNLYTGIEMPNTKWSNGLHQFVSLKHTNKLTAESLKAIFLANVNYVKKYGQKIIGMTGTLGESAELSLMKNVYGVTAFRMPRYMSERFYEDPATVVGSEVRWIELVADHVVKEQQNTEGFDISDLSKEVQKQQGRLTEAQEELEKNKDEVKKHSGQITEITVIRTEMSTLSNQYMTPSDLDSYHALNSIESLVERIESSHFNTEEFSQSANTQFVNPLKVSVADLRRHNKEVTSQTNKSAELYAKIQIDEKNLKFTRFTNPTSSSKLLQINNELDSHRHNKAEVDDIIESLKGQTNTKRDIVLKGLTAMQQGLTRPIVQYIQIVEAKKRNYEKKVEEYKEEVKDRNTELSSAQEALESGVGGRAVLVICRNKNDADAVAATLAARKTLKKLYRYTGTNDSITELDPQTGFVIKTKVDLVRLKPHDVIVATNIAGRGTSLKTTKVVEQCGGLHVVLAYVPSNIRVEKQAWGRTSRHGKNGSGKFIVCDPRVSTSQEIIDIDYLLSERDLHETDRLEKFETETIPRVNMENMLFDNFSAFSKEISKQYSKKISSDLQQKELRDKWAFFLEEQDEELEQFFKKPTEAKQRLLQSFEDFKEERKSDLEDGGELGLISSPGNLIHVVSGALRKEAYDQAKDAAQKIIDADPNLAGYGYYYLALARFEKGIDKTETMKKAMKELEMAIFLFNKQIDSLQKQSQIVSSVNSAIQKRGIGTNSDFFGKSIANTISLLHAHIWAAEKACGRAIQYADFDTSAINGDSTKEVFDMLNAIAKEKEKIRNDICPQCLSERVEIRLRITTKDKTKVEFLTSASTRKGDQNKAVWTEDTLEVCGDVTDEEMVQVKRLGLPFELAMYVVGDIIADTANSDDKSSLVVFPPSVAYAVPKILENVRKIAKDGKLKGVEEKERSDLDKLFFDSLLSEKLIKNVIDDISDGDEQNYLILDTEYTKKALGKWDSQDFCGIGQDMKKWFLQAASSRKAIPESEILTEAQRQLVLNQKSNMDNRRVLKSIVRLGIGNIEKRQPVKKEKIEIIKSHDKVIALRNITDDKFNEVSFESYGFLERHKDAILTKLKESKGDTLEAKDFDGIFTTVDERIEFVQSNSFLYLQKLLQVHGIAKSLCDRLEVRKIDEHFKAPLDEVLEDIDETINVEKMSKISFASELQGSLFNQNVIHMPRVRFGIDNSKDDIKKLKDNIQKELKEKMKGLVDRIKEKDEKADDKEKAVMDDILKAVEGTITELVKLKPKIKVEFQRLESILGDETPPELRDFIEAAVEITFKVVKDKVFSDYWDWGAFAVAMIGIAQIAAGAALTVFTGGLGAQIGGALISEGIGDIMYATMAGLTGTFSWKEYGIQKAVSLAVSAVGIVTAGISTLATKQAQVAAVTTKAAAVAVAKVIAKKIVLKGISILATIGMEKLSEVARKEIFRSLKDNFQNWVESDLRSIEEVEEIKLLLEAMMDKYGKAQADKYIIDALGESQILAAVTKLESTIVGGISSAAGKIGGTLAEAAERLKESQSDEAKTFGYLAKTISCATKTTTVLYELKKSVDCVPDIYKILHRRLKEIKTEKNDNAKDKWTGKEKADWVDGHMKNTSKVIYTAIEEIVGGFITEKAVGKLVGKGTEKLYSGTIDSLRDDLDKLQKHAENMDAITAISSKKGQLTKQEQKNIMMLQNELMEQDNHYDTILKEVNPRQDKDKKVMYNGEEVTLGSLEAKLGSGGFRLLSNSDGASAPILIRPKYDEFINGISLDRPANFVHLHAMAKEAQLNISLEIEESGGKTRTEQVEPNEGQGGNSVYIQLLKNDQCPEGHYMLKGEKGEIIRFQSIGAASAAQVILYQKARNDGKDHDEAMTMANSREDLQAFLDATKKTALNDDADNESGTRYYYESAEYEKRGDVLGGSSPHPLTLFPEPDKIVQKINLKPVPVRQMKEFVRELALQKINLKHIRQKGPVLDELNSKIPKQIFTRVLGELRLRSSTKVTLAADSEQQKGGDVKIQTSKETLKTMVDRDPSSLQTASTFEEKLDLDGSATEKFKRLAKQAGIEMTILTRFNLTEEQTFHIRKNTSEGDAPKDDVPKDDTTPIKAPSQVEKNKSETIVEEGIEVMTLSLTRSITRRTEVRPKWGDMEVHTLRRLKNG